MKSSLFKGLKNAIEGFLKRDSERSLEEEETQSTNNSRSPYESSFTDSFFGSVSESTSSMVAQKLPPSYIPSNQKPKPTNKALFSAVVENNPQKVRELLDPLPSASKPDVNCRDCSCNAPLHIAAFEGFLEVCEAILDYGVSTDLNIANKRMETPLHLACKAGHKKLVQLLIRSGAEVNSQDQNSDSPLHIASRHGRSDLVSWLLTKQADPTLKNKNGLTACEEGPEEVQEVFRRYYRGSIRSSTVSLDTTSKEICIEQMVTEECKLQGTTANDYIPLQELGKGSFGEVYLVKKQDTEKLYAMKVLRKEKIMKQNLIRYAMTERNVLSYVKHPFIVSLNFAFQTPEKLFLILDYCPGGDLGSHLMREKRFSEEKAFIYACEVLLALEELHKRDIIFRDLKPDNIVLDSKGHAMLTDFGLSKEGIYNNYTTKSFCGSVAYLAPEMIRRQGHGKSVDWYLFGVLIYEMLVGVPPFFSPDREQLFKNIQSGVLRIPSALSSQTKDLLKHLLIRDPCRRLGSAKDAEEIKSHPYFEGVDWGKVYKRGLSPPLPSPPSIIPVKIDPESVFGNLNDQSTTNRVTGWTFVSE